MSESPDPARSVLYSRSLLEALAAVEHERWSHWQQYVHSRGKRTADGSLVVPADLVARWETQMVTRYEDLSEGEKDSDRNQVRRYLPIIEAALHDDEA